MAEENTPQKPKKTVEERRKEVWTSGVMPSALESYNKKHPEGIDMSVPANTDIVFKEFFGKDIMDETPEPEVCGWCEKTKGEKETDCQCGRPPKFSEDIIRKSKKYLQSCEDEEDEFHKTRGEKSDGYERLLKVNLPSVGGLADYLEVSRSTLYEWEKEYPMFSDIMERLRVKQEKNLINKGMSGEYNPTIAKVLLTKHGYREGIDATTKDKEIPGAIISDEQFNRIIRTRAEKLDSKEGSK